MLPSFMVLERGSSTAMMRALPTFCRRPAMVVVMAVGWWAKSSYTVMPRTQPFTSMRRFTFWNCESASQAT